VYSFGDEHGLGAAPSSEHAKLEPASAEKLKLAAVLWVVALGWPLIAVSGAVVSIRHVWTAGLGSTCDALSSVRTRSVCSPSASGPTLCGDRHSVNAAPSSEHSYSTPASFEPKVNRALVFWVSAFGPVTMDVSGGSSTCQSYSAGESSSTPSALRARTASVWSPSRRPV
jgi:hypothetical protein